MADPAAVSLGPAMDRVADPEVAVAEVAHARKRGTLPVFTPVV